MLSPNMTVSEEVKLVCEVLDKLTRKQVRVMEVFAAHSRNYDIAHHMFVCEQTIKNHMRNIRQRLGVGSKVELKFIAEKLVAYKRSPWTAINKTLSANQQRLN